MGDRGAVVPPLRSSQLCHHLVDLAVVDLGAIPFHAVRGLEQVAPNLTLNHTAHELLKGGFPIGAILYARFGGVVEELIILNPEGDIPGFVVSPTVVVECHVFGLFVDVVSLEGQRGDLCPPCATISGVHAHRFLQGFVRCHVVVCISVLASNPTIASEAEHSGSDRRPAGFGQGHGGEGLRLPEGGGHARLFVDVISLDGLGSDPGGWWSLAEVAPSRGDLVDLLAG